MGLLETQNFLARLYTDEHLRRDFIAAPEKIGEENNLSAREISEITGIFPDEINAFAESLVWKRLREVEKFLPRTRTALDGKFQIYFREFAPNFNPQSVKKHLEDALAFATFLQSNETVSNITKNAAKYESAKLEFYHLDKNIVVRLFDYELDGSKRKHFKVWLRIGKRELVF